MLLPFLVQLRKWNKIQVVFLILVLHPSTRKKYFGSRNFFCITLKQDRHQWHWSGQNSVLLYTQHVSGSNCYNDICLLVSCPRILLLVGHIKNDPEWLGLLSVQEVIPDRNIYLFFLLFLIQHLGKFFSQRARMFVLLFLKKLNDDSTVIHHVSFFTLAIRGLRIILNCLSREICEPVILMLSLLCFIVKFLNYI